MYTARFIGMGLLSRWTVYKDNCKVNTIYSFDYNEWHKAALHRGYTVENNGGCRMVAHADGEEKGEWDANYARTGAGWFY